MRKLNNRSRTELKNIKDNETFEHELGTLTYKGKNRMGEYLCKVKLTGSDDIYDVAYDISGFTIKPYNKTVNTIISNMPISDKSYSEENYD